MRLGGRDGQVHSFRSLIIRGLDVLFPQRLGLNGLYYFFFESEGKLWRRACHAPILMLIS
jgi:hypothetical protein